VIEAEPEYRPYNYWIGSGTWFPLPWLRPVESSAVSRSRLGTICQTSSTSNLPVGLALLDRTYRHPPRIGGERVSGQR
jgi:hypothetical protein